MNKLENGEKKLFVDHMKWLWVPWMVLVGASLFILGADLREKETRLAHDKAVLLGFDFSNIQAVALQENKTIDELLTQLQAVPMGCSTLSVSESPANEDLIRHHGFQVAWQFRESEGFKATDFMKRIRKGDVVLSSPNVAFGYPGYVNVVARLIKEKNGLLALTDISRPRGIDLLARNISQKWIKTHILHLDEVLGYAQFNLWSHRLFRAVRERWVRFLIISIPVDVSFQESIRFLGDISNRLTSSGYKLGMGDSLTWSTPRSVPPPIRLIWAFLLALGGPMAGLSLIWICRHKPPLMTFILVNLLTVLTGLAVHSAGSFPAAAAGIMAMPAVKALLVGPLILSFLLLLFSDELKKLLNYPLTVRSILIGGGLMIVIGGIYIMRSGNLPLIPASPFERGLRDSLDQIFWIRPRFKEVLIGQPFLILGLTRLYHRSRLDQFLKDGRLFLLIGLIGQISILNTFAHFSTSLSMGTLRTLHGVWMGIFLSIPLIVLVTHLHGEKKTG